MKNIKQRTVSIYKEFTQALSYPRGGAGLYYQCLFLPPPFFFTDRERETERERERERANGLAALLPTET